MVSSTTGIITTYAGNGAYGSNGDGGPATLAQLNCAFGIAFDPSNDDLYIGGAGKIRKVVRSTGNIVTFAGGGISGSVGDGVPALGYLIPGLAVDKSQNVYIADVTNNRVRMIRKSDGTISTIAGIAGAVGSTGNIGVGGAATSAQLIPSGVAVDSFGNVYVSSFSQVLRIVNGIIVPFAGTGVCTQPYGYGCYGGSTGDGGPAIAAQLGFKYTAPGGGYFNLNGQLAVDAGGDVFIADYFNNRVRMVNVTTISYPGGSGGGGGCPAGMYAYPPAPCTMCPAGSFSAAAGATTCTPCPNGQFSNPGASACQACAA